MWRSGRKVLQWKMKIIEETIEPGKLGRLMTNTVRSLGGTDEGTFMVCF